MLHNVVINLAHNKEYTYVDPKQNRAFQTSGQSLIRKAIPVVPVLHLIFFCPLQPE